MRALVVEDSAPIRQRIRGLIEESAAADVCEAGSVAEALAALAAAPFDAIVLDIHLPDGSGFAVLDRVMAARAHAVVVVLTNDASEQHRRECLARGAHHFFDKSREFARAVDVVLAAAVPP